METISDFSSRFAAVVANAAEVVVGRAAYEADDAVMM
jgi:hypothetical protein